MRAAGGAVVAAFVSRVLTFTVHVAFLAFFLHFSEQEFLGLPPRPPVGMKSAFTGSNLARDA